MDWKYYVYLMMGFAFLFAIKIFTPKLKGWAGEKNVSSILSKLPKDAYIVIDNCMIPSKKGTTQIDHIIVSIYGIFVIETKNYRGWILGSEHSDQWVKNIYGKKYSFMNPIHQNYGHVLALSNLLGLEKELFMPIVVFSSQADLKVKTKSPVVYMRALKKSILSYRTECFKREDLHKLVEKINHANITSKDDRKKHNQAIKINMKQQRQATREGICPKCGGLLVKRKGKYGDFIGCSKYPNCRYTLKKDN